MLSVEISADAEETETRRERELVESRRAVPGDMATREEGEGKSWTMRWYMIMRAKEERERVTKTVGTIPLRTLQKTELVSAGSLSWLHCSESPDFLLGVSSGKVVLRGVEQTSSPPSDDAAGRTPRCKSASRLQPLQGVSSRQKRRPMWSIPRTRWCPFLTRATRYELLTSSESTARNRRHPNRERCRGCTTDPGWESESKMQVGLT